LTIDSLYEIFLNFTFHQFLPTIHHNKKLVLP